MSLQDGFPEVGKPELLMTVDGQDLIGLPVKVRERGQLVQPRTPLLPQQHWPGPSLRCTSWWSQPQLLSQPACLCCMRRRSSGAQPPCVSRRHARHRPLCTA